MKRTTGLLAVTLLALPLAACGSYFDNDSVSVCGTTICVSTPVLLCAVETRITYLSFEVSVVPGRDKATYTLRGNTDLSGAERKKSYTVVADKPVRHETSKADEDSFFDAGTVEVYEGNRRVRSLEMDSDDLCPSS